MSGISCPFDATNPDKCVEGCDHYLSKEKKCDSNCPVNSYKSYVDNMRIYYCFECYTPCDGCYGEGVDNNMKWGSCISGYILYNGNCYQIKDSNLKTF